MIAIRDELKIMIVGSILMITVGSVWLWGPVPLLVIGGLILIASFFVDF